MSRVAKMPITVPKGVSVTLDGQEIQIKGNKGQLHWGVHNDVAITYEDNAISFAPNNNTKSAEALAGTTRQLVNNMVIGVTEGFQKELQLVGVGYRAQLKGNTLILTLGHSHPIHYDVPEGISIETPSQTDIVVKGTDKRQVGQVCADIMKFRKIEPYKGKGVRPKGLVITLKEAKKK